MRNEKETSIRLILIGLLLKITPLFILGAAIQSPEIDIDSLQLRHSLLIVFCILCFFFAGYVVSIKGCRRYIKAKGYSTNWGWLGLFSIFGLPFLLLTPYRHRNHSRQSSNQDIKSHWPERIDAAELILCGVFAIPILMHMGVWLISRVSSWGFSEIIESPSAQVLLSFIISVIWIVSIINILQKLDVNILGLLGYKQRIKWKLIAVIVGVKIIFAWGANSLTLYYLSFLAPSYVEAFVNRIRITSISSAIFYCLFSIVLGPIIEELFCRGIILQKWSIKWGIKSGIATSSLLFAILHFRFDFFTLFISGVLYAVLFFQGFSLMTPILCHVFYNTFSAAAMIIKFIDRNKHPESILISAEKYQELIEPMLAFRFFAMIISVTFLGYFIIKHFPRKYVVVPPLPPIS